MVKMNDIHFQLITLSDAIVQFRFTKKWHWLSTLMTY